MEYAEEKISVTEFYNELLEEIDQHAANPESPFFDGIRAVIIGDRIKRGEVVTKEERMLWEKWEREHAE